MRIAFVLLFSVYTLQPCNLWSQEGGNKQEAQRPPQGPPQGPRGFGGPIELGADDKQIFEDPPSNIVDKRDGIEHGKLEMIEYNSKTVGTLRKMNVYTPPGYSKEIGRAHV